MDIKFPKTTINFEYSMSPVEVENVAEDLRRIMECKDSIREMPEKSPGDYNHIIRETICPTTRKFLESIIDFANAEGYMR